MQLRSGNITNSAAATATQPPIKRSRNVTTDSETIDAAKALCRLAVQARIKERISDFQKMAAAASDNWDTESDTDSSALDTEEENVVLDAAEQENEMEDDYENMDLKSKLLSNTQKGLKYQLYTFSTSTFPKHAKCVINLETPFQKTLLNTKRASLLMCDACVNNTPILLELQMRCYGCNIYWCKQTSDWVYQFDDHREMYAIGLTNHRGKRQHMQPFNYVPFQSGQKQHVATMYSRALDCLFFYNTETQLYEGNLKLSWDFQQKRLFVKLGDNPTLDMDCFFR